MDEQGRWASMDPDTLYHARRLARVWNEGELCERDPYLAYPSELDEGGAAIPWPPYYAHVLLWTHPYTSFVSSDPLPSDLEIEMSVASLPALFSALTSALIAIGAARMGGAAAGLCAGLLHATTFGAVRYGALGNGDHHAFVSLLAAALFFLAGRALSRTDRATIVPALVSILAAGACAGALIGTWVASLLHVAGIEIALVLAWACAGGERRPRLARHALVFHLVALIALIPALDGDPWLEERPFALIVLSWLQPAILACTAVCWLPWAWPAGPSGRIRGAMSLGWLGVMAVAALVPGSPLRTELAEGMEWAGAGGEFMRWVNESQPLTSPAQVAKHLGLAILVLPLALAWALRELARSRRLELAPWIGAAIVFVPLAFVQERFAEAATVPLALLAALCLERAIASVAPPRAALLARARLVPALAILANLGVARNTLRAARLGTLGAIAETEERALHRGRRELCRWLLERTPLPGEPPAYSVLAQWDQGHLIEWAAVRPTVATNFGTYLGRDSYLDPWRFFLALDESAAEAILERHRARYVLLDSRFRRNLEAMVSVLHPGEREAWLGSGDGSARWLESIGARMLEHGGGPVRTSGLAGLGGLRLVHVSPDEHSDVAAPGAEWPVPIGWIYQQVPGARLEARGAPGDRLGVAVRLRYPGCQRELMWRAESTSDSGGVARLRVPYATDRPNGDGVAAASFGWSGRSGALSIPEHAVLSGETLILP